jgi:hypothetical protein
MRKHKKRTAAAVTRRAKKLIEMADKPECQDDPAWLRRRAEMVMQYAARRQAAHVRKVESIRKSRSKKSTQS